MQNPTDFLKQAFEKKLTLAQAQKKIALSLQAGSVTLEQLQRDCDNWPQLELVTQEEEFKPPINLKQIAPLFTAFGKLIEPMEDQYQGLLSSREQLTKARNRLAHLQKEQPNNKKAILEAAKALRELLGEQRKIEQTFIEVLIHQWRNAVISLAADAHKIISK